eukprot:m.63462 g.63462  ORF g.63462 m.63462 type:complete len:311 (-) comp17789_c1_seq1:275-1207(-)
MNPDTSPVLSSARQGRHTFELAHRMWKKMHDMGSCFTHDDTTSSKYFAGLEPDLNVPPTLPQSASIWTTSAGSTSSCSIAMQCVHAVLFEHMIFDAVHLGNWMQRSATVSINLCVATARHRGAKSTSRLSLPSVYNCVRQCAQSVEFQQANSAEAHPLNAIAPAGMVSLMYSGVCQLIRVSFVTAHDPRHALTAAYSRVPAIVCGSGHNRVLCTPSALTLTRVRKSNDSAVIRAPLVWAVSAVDISAVKQSEQPGVAPHNSDAVSHNVALEMPVPSKVGTARRSPSSDTHLLAMPGRSGPMTPREDIVGS